MCLSSDPSHPPTQDYGKAWQMGLSYLCRNKSYCIALPRHQLAGCAWHSKPFKSHPQVETGAQPSRQVAWRRHGPLSGPPVSVEYINVHVVPWATKPGMVAGVQQHSESRGRTKFKTSLGYLTSMRFQSSLGSKLRANIQDQPGK